MNQHQPPIRFDNSYAALPERFYERRDPLPVARPSLIRLNRELAEDLGIDAGWLASPEGLDMLAGNRLPDNADPIAQAYAGHQFGNFVPQLGDGRALLIGEVVDGSGRRRDIQLKGSGRTAFSRGGDGRSALGPVLREYVVSEAMARMGVATTRALAAVTSGEQVLRETVLPGGVLTRVASSHVRVGTFQYFAVRGDTEALRLLADHVIARHYPQLQGVESPYVALLAAVVEAQARLVASWMHLGFIHGVMNTDNFSIAGETIDYGPCAFMDEFHPSTVFSSIDHAGRYAYGNQPHIAHWNLTRFAETLLPLFGADEDAAVARAQERLEAFPELFNQALQAGLRRKLGFTDAREEDAELFRDLFQLMADAKADFTLTFRGLAEDAAAEDMGTARALFADAAGFDGWVGRWRERLRHEHAEPEARRASMLSANPKYIPRNHLVEATIQAAVERDDFGPFHELCEITSRPYDEQPGREIYALPPQPEERVLQTFCGT
ncbi:YdiU family protein [Chelativorans sp. ZYF759]|uniref:protein adenylyltransferase SelO n=1 Tax=Chelativorans sp. ZYF759 TaxID=2692213 RepID=UPI00145C8615|nr:YdiU family protein [Chelativorans sp. ZYF759]NMG40658.1 YdiU family protein [Chelativorans sp. ZYF759]